MAIAGGEFYLGLDVGTSRVKGALMPVGGGEPAVVASAMAPELKISAWRAEQDPRRYVTALAEIVAKLKSAVPVDKWRAIGLATQRGTFLAGDEAREPVTALWSWLDRRGIEVGGDRWDWLQRDATLRGRTVRLWSLASWLAEMLVGESVEAAPTMTPEAARVAVNGVARSAVVVAGWRGAIDDREFARGLGLPAGLPMVIAGGDKNAELVGAGVVAPGDAALSFGTALSLGMLSPNADGSGGFRTPAILPGLTQWEVGLPFGGGAMPWAEKLLGVGEVRLPEVGGPMFIPYVEGSLEVAGARAAWFGMDAAADSATLRGAVLEGLILDTLRQRVNLPDSPKRLSLVGGGARYPELGQWVADAFQAPATRPKFGDAGVRGAVMAAAIGLGDLPNSAAGWAKAKENWALRASDTVTPRAAEGARWATRLALFLERATTCLS